MKFIKKHLNKAFLKYLCLAIFFFILCGVSYRLLFLEQIKGTEFVALIIAAMFTCLIINFLDEIQELSIGGNLLKLKEAKSEVNATIEQLKLFRIEAFRLFLSNAAEFPGGWGSIGFIDDRAEKFIKLFKQIESVGVIDELKKEINAVTLLILDNHLRRLLDIDPKGELSQQFYSKKMTTYPSEKQILIAIKSEYIDASMNHYNWTKERVEEEFNNAIDIYTALLSIQNATSED